MTFKNGGDVELWRGTALFLGGIVLSMTAFYVAEFRHTVTRDEAQQIVDQMRPGPPWVQDRTNVLQRLDADRAMILELMRREKR